jgi:hypothetical protein
MNNKSPMHRRILRCLVSTFVWSHLIGKAACYFTACRLTLSGDSVGASTLAERRMTVPHQSSDDFDTNRTTKRFNGFRDSPLKIDDILNGANVVR